MPLRIAAKIDEVDSEYFEREIEPLLDQSHVEFIGEIGPEEKNEFLAVLAHELRNPLAAICNSSTLLRGLPCTDETFGRIRDVIDRQSHNLERLVNDLLDSARITAGKISLDRNYVAMADIIDEALETVHHQFGANRHELSLSLPSLELCVHGDKLRLVQIFVNLLANAIKYTPAGGRIDLSATADDHEVSVTVVDTGEHTMTGGRLRRVAPHVHAGPHGRALLTWRKAAPDTTTSLRGTEPKQPRSARLADLPAGPYNLGPWTTIA